jgi:hypothetical protein
VLNAKDSAIYIKIFSSLPDWKQSERFTPYHFLQIGISKAKKELPSTKACVGKDFPTEQQMAAIRSSSLKTIVEKLQEIKNDSTVKINYDSSTCIISSKCTKKITTEEIHKVKLFEKRLININQINCGDHTKKLWCKILQKKYEEHLCQYCSGDHPRDNKEVADKSPQSGTHPRDKSIMADSRYNNGEDSLQSSPCGSPLTNAYYERSDDIHSRIPSI